MARDLTLRRLLLIGMLAGLCAADRAGAAPMLDQNFVPPTNLGANIGIGFAYVGQTVTPGISGGLTKAVVYFGRFSAYSGLWQVSIRSVNASGQPTASILALETLTSAQVTTTETSITTVNFSTPPILQAGQPFAIVVNAFPAVEHDGKGVWGGTTDMGPLHYAGGMDFASHDGVSFGNTDSGRYDLSFQTYVDPVLVPEPAMGTGLALFAVASVGLARRRRSLAR